MLVAGLSCLIMNLSAPDNLWFVITLAMIGKLIILYTYHFIISTSTHQLVIVVVLNICTYVYAPNPLFPLLFDFSTRIFSRKCLHWIYRGYRSSLNSLHYIWIYFDLYDFILLFSICSEMHDRSLQCNHSNFHSIPVSHDIEKFRSWCW